MDMLHKLENQLAPLFKDLPELPKNIKETLVSWWPVLAIILGVLQLFAALSLFGLITAGNKLVEQANYLAAYTRYPVYTYSETDKLIIYGGVVLLAINAVIFIMAYTPLKQKLKRGWDLLFLASLLNLAYGVVQIFISGRGVGSFIVSLLGTAITLYLLYQIKGSYTSKKQGKKA